MKNENAYLCMQNEKDERKENHNFSINTKTHTNTKAKHLHDAAIYNIIAPSLKFLKQHTQREK